VSDGKVPHHPRRALGFGIAAVGVQIPVQTVYTGTHMATIEVGEWMWISMVDSGSDGLRRRLANYAT
jgi:hypothetical protein